MHVIGACGRAIGGVALEMKRAGTDVTASDSYSYGGMRERLAEGGIDCEHAYDETNLAEDRDFVLAGSLVEPTNPELLKARRLGIPVSTYPEFLAKFCFAGTRRWVVAGTNGKSTTAALLIHLMSSVGPIPDHLIGAIPRNEPRQSVRLRRAGEMVLEGDEYPCGLGDTNPKFLHYQPEILILVNIQHDHVDIYPDRHRYLGEFKALLERMSPDALLVANSDDPGVRELLRGNARPFRVIKVGFHRGADERIEFWSGCRDGGSFWLAGQKFRMSLPGRMNATNAALAVISLREGFHLPITSYASPLSRFLGVEGRMERVLSGPNLWHYTDEAYHPHSLDAVITTLSNAHRKSPLHLVIQLRGAVDAGGEMSQQMLRQLARADSLCLFDPGIPLPGTTGIGYNSEAVAHALRERGMKVRLCRNPARLAEDASSGLVAGSVVLTALAKRTIPEEAALFSKLAWKAKSFQRRVADMDQSK